MAEKALKEAIHLSETEQLSPYSWSDEKAAQRKRRGRLDKLTILRISRGLRQQDVAFCMGITTSYYGMIEQGSRLPQLELAYKLANFFNTSIEDIFFTL